MGFNKMGLAVSRPECNVPVRALLNVDNARAILTQCARLKVYYMIGILVVIAAVLFVGWIATRNKAPTEFRVPAWLLLVPLGIFLLYTITIKARLDQTLYSEMLEYQLSGMSKKDYLIHKAGDDRANRSFAASATSAGLLTGSNILGPFLRADR